MTTPDNNPTPSDPQASANSTKPNIPTANSSQPQTNSKPIAQSPSYKGLGRKILAIGGAVVAVIALVADVSQISDVTLGICNNYDVSAIGALCKHVKSLVPSRDTPSAPGEKLPEEEKLLASEKLPKFIRSQPKEQPEPRFKRSL
ncbi:hypothetical protein RIVM261_075510 [Rivularia sp. IAM M-261]|nr:hypothetical protein RIVM261_075510 [Rivularia sp. IAM M-261]